MPDPRSLPEFARRFPDDASCIEYLIGVRWPEGFACPWCGWTGTPYRFTNKPAVLRCRQCQRDISLLADTVMEGSHTPLHVWFWAAYLVTSQTPGMSAVQFQRQLGLKRNETAFNMLHKLRAAMVRPERDRIGGSGQHDDWRVEVDEAYVGGRTRGEGRGVTHKALVGVAVEVRDKPGGPRAKSGKFTRRDVVGGRVRLRHLDDRSPASCVAFVQEAVEPGSIVVTDGYVGYDGLRALGYWHEPEDTYGDPEVVEAYLPMCHVVISNLKTWLLGTHHGVSPKHLQAYLNEFVFRFNRRFYPMTAFHSVLGIAVRVEGPTYEGLYRGTWRHPNPAAAGWSW